MKRSAAAHVEHLDDVEPLPDDPDAAPPFGTGRPPEPDPEPEPEPAADPAEEGETEPEEPVDPVEPVVWTRLPTRIGPVLLVTDGDALTELHLAPHDAALDRCRTAGRRHTAHPVLAAAAAQLEEYLALRRTTFDLPLALRGTDVQRAVWATVGTVPYATTATAAKLAARLDAVTPQSFARAVAAAPVPVVIPTHRLARATGTPANHPHLLALERGTLF